MKNIFYKLITIYICIYVKKKDRNTQLDIKAKWQHIHMIVIHIGL